MSIDLFGRGRPGGSGHASASARSTSPTTGSSSYSTTIASTAAAASPGCLGGDRGDLLAVEAHLVDRDDRTVFDRVPVVRIDVLEVVSGEHAGHTGHPLGLGRVDRDDAAVRDRARAGPGRAARAARGCRRRTPPGRAASRGHRGAGSTRRSASGPRAVRRSSSFDPGELRDSFDDRAVPGAAAEVAGEALLDPLLAVEAAVLEEGADREQHPRRAEAALERSVAREGVLEPGELRPLGESFDRRHLPAFDLHGEHAARADREPVDEDGAGAADLHVAGALRAVSPSRSRRKSRRSSCGGTSDRAGVRGGRRARPLDLTGEEIPYTAGIGSLHSRVDRALNYLLAALQRLTALVEITTGSQSRPAGGVGLDQFDRVTRQMFSKHECLETVVCLEDLSLINRNSRFRDSRHILLDTGRLKREML